MFFPFKFGGECHFPKLQGRGVLFAQFVMHKFAALLTHGLLMTIEILHLNLLVILVHQNFGCGFILLTILILLFFF